MSLRLPTGSNRGQGRSGSWMNSLGVFRVIPSSRVSHRLLLVLHRSALRSSIGFRVLLLRPLLTPALPAMAFAVTFRTFRQALLSGANDNSQVILQVSLGKSIHFHCASSRFTWRVQQQRLRRPIRLLFRGSRSVPFGSLARPVRPSIRFLFVTSQL